MMSSNGRSIAVYSWGRGPTVLVVHGWNGRAAQLAGFVRPLTSAGHNVLALDAPAHGRSPGRRTDAFEIAEALATLDRTYGPFAAVVTHSMGALCCATAMSAGRLRTQRVACLAPAMSRTSLVSAFGKILRLPGSVLSDLTDRVNAFVTPDFWNQVVTCPALLIHDLEDDFLPYADVAALERRWPAAKLITTRGLGHNHVVRNPQVIDHVVNFLTTGCSFGADRKSAAAVRRGAKASLE